MIISIIAAMSKNRVIGINNRLPWHLPADLAHFKRVTLGKPILMGRHTHHSIGRSLPGRPNIVLSKNPNCHVADGCLLASDLPNALALVKEHKELMVIGGSGLYAHILPSADYLYLTLIDEEFVGDTWFPEFDQQEWRELKCEAHAADAANPYSYKFLVFERLQTGAIQKSYAGIRY